MFGIVGMSEMFFPSDEGYKAWEDWCCFMVKKKEQKKGRNMETVWGGREDEDGGARGDVG